MMRNQRLDDVSAVLRRVGRRIRLEWRRLPGSYHIGVWSFALLLLEALAALTLSLLRRVGVPVQISPGAVVVIVLVTCAIALICMVSIVIGMVTLSFTKKSDHDERLFPRDGRVTKTARRDLPPSPTRSPLDSPPSPMRSPLDSPPSPTRSPLDLPYQDEISALNENLRFLIALFLFWLWVSWAAFGGRWFADDSIGKRGISLYVALFLTAFASMEVMRRFHRLYDGLRCYHGVRCDKRQPFKGLNETAESLESKEVRETPESNEAPESAESNDAPESAESAGVRETTESKGDGKFMGLEGDKENGAEK